MAETAEIEGFVMEVSTSVLIILVISLGINAGLLLAFINYILGGFNVR